MNLRAITTLQRVRKRIEELRVAERHRAELAAAHAAQRAEQALHAANASPITQPAVNGESVAMIRTASYAIDEERSSARRISADTQRQARAATERHVAAATQRMTIERLGERRRAEAALLAARRAERELDDLAVRRWRAR